MSSSAASSSANNTKTTETDEKASETQKDQQQQKTGVALEEDDEFEDFPVEDWTKEDTEVPGGNAHLWEESWDDDDINEDFAAQLKEEMKKVEANKKS